MTAVRHSRAAVFLFLILKMRISGRFRAMEIRIFRYMRGLLRGARCRHTFSTKWFF